MEWKILHFYPDLMSLYGSYANAAVLKRYLERLGGDVSVHFIRPGEQADLAAADFIFMGAGTERSQKAALADFARYGQAVRAAADSGTAQLFAGTGHELLGQTLVDNAGQEYQGIGLGQFTSVQGKQRFVGDVYGTTALCPEPVVGFMNKCARISGVETPLLSACAMGFGNEAEGGPEGFCRGNVLASELTGPILVKNPQLLKVVVKALYDRRGTQLPAEQPVDDYAAAGYAITAEQLRLRSEKTAG